MPIEERTYSCNTCKTKYTGIATTESFRKAEEEAIKCEGLPFLLNEIQNGTLYRAFISKEKRVFPGSHGKERLAPIQDSLSGQGYLIIGDWWGVRDADDEGSDIHIRRYHALSLSSSIINDRQWYETHSSASFIDGRQIEYLRSQRAAFSQSRPLPRGTKQLMAPTLEELEEVRSALAKIISDRPVSDLFDLKNSLGPDFANLVSA